MKSLMEEASSISKAIEQGWTNAGKPKEFSIKIYEEPQKNFFGLTTHPAKIGIFFSEPTKVESRPRRTREPEIKQESKPAARTYESKPPRVPAEKAPEQPRKEVKKPVVPQEDLGPIWSDEMVTSTKEWVTELVSLLGVGSVPFTIEPQRFHVRIEFGSGLLPDKDKQKHLFAILSGLLLTMLKRHYKRPLRGYKIVLLEKGMGETHHESQDLDS